jgi:hypothetical protein
MSDVRTIWQDLEARRSYPLNRERAGLLLLAGLLITLCVAEVLFLNHFVGSVDAANTLGAAEDMLLIP